LVDRESRIGFLVQVKYGVMKMFHIVQKRSQSKGDYYCVYDGGRLVFMTTVLKQANRWLRLNPGFVATPPKAAPAAAPAPVSQTRVA